MLCHKYIRTPIPTARTTARLWEIFTFFICCCFNNRRLNLIQTQPIFIKTGILFKLSPCLNCMTVKIATYCGLKLKKLFT